MSIPHLLRDSSSVSNVFCRRNSSIKVAVISRSRSEDAATDIGGVTPKYLPVVSSRITETKRNQTLSHWRPFDAEVLALVRRDDGVKRSATCHRDSDDAGSPHQSIKPNSR